MNIHENPDFFMVIQRGASAWLCILVVHQRHSSTRQKQETHQLLCSMSFWWGPITQQTSNNSSTCTAWLFFHRVPAGLLDSPLGNWIPGRKGAQRCCHTGPTWCVEAYIIKLVGACTCCASASASDPAPQESKQDTSPTTMLDGFLMGRKGPQANISLHKIGVTTARQNLH